VPGVQFITGTQQKESPNATIKRERFERVSHAVCGALVSK